MTTEALVDGRQPIAWNRPRKKNYRLWVAVFLLPQAVLFLVFTLYPIIANFVYSAYDWPGYGPLAKFVGLGNYADVIADPLFRGAVRNTFVFMLGEVGIQLPLALLMALVLNDRMLKGATFYRAVYFIPVVTTTAIVGIMMTWIFGAYRGVVNTVLGSLQLIDQPIDWLGDPSLALQTVILVAVWHSFGIKLIYWLGGLQSIPYEVYEAAQLDGAGWWKTLRYVTLPLLTNIGVVILLISVKGALHVFDLILTMTGGGPDFATQTVDVYIYRYAFAGTFGVFRVGYAAAASVVFGLGVLMLTGALFALQRAVHNR